MSPKTNTEAIECGFRGRDHRQLPNVTPCKVQEGCLNGHDNKRSTRKPVPQPMPAGNPYGSTMSLLQHDRLPGVDRALPRSCLEGSQRCQCNPMFRGTPPPLPPSLCGYQIPIVITQCSCTNAADCQVLSPFCPGACPIGSLSCQCNPLQRR